jgi:hypothetical protein
MDFNWTARDYRVKARQLLQGKPGMSKPEQLEAIKLAGASLHEAAKLLQAEIDGTHSPEPSGVHPFEDHNAGAGPGPDDEDVIDLGTQQPVYDAALKKLQDVTGQPIDGIVIVNNSNENFE